MGTPVHGRVTKLQYSTDDVTYADVIGMSDGTFDIMAESAESTDKDSGGNEFLYGRNQCQLDINGNLEEDEASQQALLSACENRTTIYLRWRARGSTTGNRQYKALFLITKATQSSPNKDVVKLAITAQSTGTITQSTVP
jgi:predicted secreted protein